MILGWIFVGGLLLLGSIYDTKNYSLPMWLVALGLVGGVAGLLCSCIKGECSGLTILCGMLPGLLSLGLAFLTREQIGYGDGWMLLMLGGCVGATAVWGIWLGGLIASCVVSVALLVFRRAKKNTRIPFVPCLLFGYVLVGIGGMLSGV